MMGRRTDGSASAIPVPDDGDEAMEGRGRGDRDENQSPAKARRAGNGVSEDVLRALLAEQQAAILRNQTDTLQAMFQSMEAKHDSRFQGIEKKLDAQVVKQEVTDQALRDLSHRLARVEEGSTTASSGGDAVPDSRRKLTLVIGGFERDSRKAFILETVRKALTDLGVRRQLDEEPFVTGPRRSTALLPFKIRAGEDMAAAKGRMHGVLNEIIRAKIKVPGRESNLWAGVSKSPGEREISSHCSWVRGVIRTLDVALEDLEHDYAAGTTWLGSSMLASSTAKAPQVDSYKIHYIPKKDGSHAWFNISACAKELGSSFEKVEYAAKNFSR